MKTILTFALTALAISGLFAIPAQGISTTLDVGLGAEESIGDTINWVTGGGFASRTAGLVNALLPLGVSTFGSWEGEVITRSDESTAGLAAATTVDALLYSDGGGLAFVGSNSNSVQVTLPSSFGFTYLVAAYDGGNGGAEAFNISALAPGTEILLPRYAQPTTGNVSPLVSSTKYQMTGWALLNPGERIPDGGLTLALLGLSCIGVAWVRKRG